jgi:hypothetical protein
MNDIYVYSIQTFEKKISHDDYCQIVAHEVCDEMPYMMIHKTTCLNVGKNRKQ